MFVDKKLNQYFNTNSKDKFVSRVIELCKDGRFNEIGVAHSPVFDESIEFAIEAIQDHFDKRMGKIYIAINKLHPTQIKIGRTSKEITEREKSLNSAGVIGKIEIVWFDQSIDSVMTETFIHQRLKSFNTEKEFFDIDPVSASQIITECTDITYDFYNKIKRIYGEHGNVMGCC